MTQDPGRSNDTPKLVRVKSYLYISKLRARRALRHPVAVSYNLGVCNDERMSGTSCVCYASEESSFS